MQRNSALAQELRPYIVALVNQAVAGSASGSGAGATIIAHDIGGAFHTGTLRDAQMPQVLLRNGTRSLAGNLVVDEGITVDGVDISAHAADPDAHHDQVHALISGDHTASGLTAGHVVRASGATAFAFAQLQHGDLGGVTANQHHNQVHGIVGGDHTVTGAALDVVGLSGTNTLGVLTPSSNPGATAKIVRTAADGSVTLQAVTVNADLYAAASAFRVINHTHDYPHAHVVINPGGSWTLDEQFGVDIDDNLLVRGYIVGKHAIQLPGALLIAHYDGPEPYESNFRGEANGHMGQVATLTGGVVYRAGKFGKAVQVAQYTLNLLSNPSFEGTYSSGIAPSWAAYSSGAATGTRAESTADYFVGAKAQRLTRTGGAGGDRWGITATSAAIGNTTAGMQVRIKVLSYTAGAIVRMYADFTGGPFGEGTQRTITASDVGEWLILTDSATVDSSDTCAFYVWIEGANADILVDAAQVEGSIVTPYCDGSLGGYSAGSVPDGSGHAWSGTAHASTSSRAAGTITYPTSGNINQYTWTIAAWVNPASVGSTDQTILRCNGTSAGYIILRLSASGAAQAYGGTAAATGASAISANTWTHLAATYDGATVRVYVNGTEAASSASSGFSGMPTLMYVGCHSTAAKFNGLIDDLVILDRAAAADEIRAVYESNAPVFAETSTWHWRSGRNRVWADAEGLWMLGATGSAVLGAYAGDDTNPSATKSWGGATLSEGDVVIGHNQSGSAAMVWDRSAGKFQFVGGGSATVQAEIATDGQISAGGGAIKLGQYGARLLTGTSRATNLASTDGSRIMWLNSEIFEADEEEYSYLGTTYYRRSLVLRTVTTDTSFNFTSHVELAANNTTQDYASFVLEAGSQIEDYTPTYAINSLARIKADMVDFVATRVKMFDSTYGAWLEIYQGNTGKAVPVLKLSQSDLSEEFIEFAGTVATGNPINTDALGSYYGRVRVSVNGTFKWLALYN